MKNKFIALALVTLVASSSIVSCTTNEDFKENVKAQNVETTTVDFKIDAENTVSATGKMIDKNAVPAYVSEVTIWANSIYPASNVLQSFTFGTGAGIDTGFSLPGVSLGTNTFGATSNGSDANKVASLTNNADWDLARQKTPYIRCASTNVTAVIKKTDNAPVNLTMKTDYGRILAKFAQSAPDADNYIATVEATVADMNDNGEWITKTLPEVTITPTTVFQWSDENALFINKATFKIRIYDNNGGVKGQLLNTINKEVQIAKATTKLCTFTVKNTDVETNLESGSIVLTFPTIGEEVIND